MNEYANKKKAQVAAEAAAVVDLTDAAAVPAGSSRAVSCSGGGELGSVWGTGTYTADSSICTAAVHAGLIDRAEGGQVTIEVIAGLDSFEGSTANGVTSSAYGAYDPAFRFQVPAN